MIFELSRALRDLLGEELATLALRAPGTGEAVYRSPILTIGPVGPFQPQGEADTPGVVIAPVSWQETDGRGQASVKMLCQVWTAEAQPEAGLETLATLAAAIRRAIRSRRMLDRHFELCRALVCLRNIETAHPYYRGEMLTIWSFPAPAGRQGLEEELDVFASGYPE